MKRCLTLMLAASGLLVADRVRLPAGEKGEPNTLIVTDANGKEHKLKTWKFTAGTRHLPWLAADGKDKNAGPEMLEFSEGKGAPLKKRVLTYVPVSSIRSLEYDAKKNAVTLRVARNAKADDDEELHGITGYVSVNQLTIEATADLGELGTAAVKFQGGIERGIKSLRFTAPTPMEKPPAGRVATIKQPSKTQPAFTVVDLQVLYLAGKGQFQTSQTLYFKETVKIDLAKIDKLAQNGAGGLDFDVTLGSGQQHTLELIERPKGSDGKSVMQLEGLVGRFAGGYRVFPMNTIGE